MSALVVKLVRLFERTRMFQIDRICQ